jgi:predicted transcriptional regulator
MRVTTSTEIIPQKVLNENTGEIETQNYQKLKTYKQLRGGFRMVYVSYDDALLQIVTSKKDLEVIIYIRDLFTYKQVENSLRAVELANALGLTRQRITTLLKRMVEIGLLKKVGTSTYRLNPFMYVPFRADGSELQREWNEFKSKEN